MLKKLFTVISLITLIQSSFSIAEAARGKRPRDEETPERRNMITTPKAPKAIRLLEQIMDQADLLAEGIDLENVEPVNIAPRRLFHFIENGE